jgi:hypothetical protein
MKILFVSLLLCFFLILPAFSQLSIDLSLFNPEARIFYAGDLVDPAALGIAPDYYFLRFGNSGASPVEVIIEFRLRTSGNVIVTAETNSFVLPPGGNYIFTNNQLNTGVADVDGQTVKLRDYFVNFDAIEGYQTIFSRTGRLPAGIYEFLVDLLIVSTQQRIPDQNPDDNILIISNPTTLEPLYPGIRVNSGEIPEVPSTTPFFIWQSDAELFNFYLYRVYEANPQSSFPPENQGAGGGEKIPVQDVLSRDPIFRGIIPGYVFQYPAETQPLIFFGPGGSPVGGSEGAFRLIESGQTYLWQIEARVPTASGQITLIPSDVYQFKVVDRETSAMNASLIKAYLRQILGERHDDYMRDLSQYDPTGTILINGERVEVEALIDLIEDLLSGKIVIENVTVEN